ncbi:uncharacterized protein EDB93DRAFT_822151 [Suillus bovinus]|uniref:uncharacterized protein n=1 Tax=Suillus bovinus TaxID=48563 RepID=UPI001B887102|nr:uncharacterized protein EDB93DRAFT_822151 [Suillus bovinus]KAG2135731.1 hypothetical protein EDB93DRAFT_822151 [Suillus bovinus]
MLREPLPGSTTTHNSGSASVVERCRQLLAPVLLMSAKSQDSSTTLDITACAAMLTDDRCREFVQQARDMKLQTDALAPHPPENPRVSAVDARIKMEDLERSVDSHGESTRTTRVWLDSDALSIGSRKDSEATLVDLPIDHKAFPPLQDSRHYSAKNITIPVKQIMEHGEVTNLARPKLGKCSNISSCLTSDGSIVVDSCGRHRNDDIFNTSLGRLRTVSYRSPGFSNVFFCRLPSFICTENSDPLYSRNLVRAPGSYSTRHT